MIEAAGFATSCAAVGAIERLDVPFRDARADDLSLNVRVGAPAIPDALAVRSVEIRGVHIELRVLGASHETRVSGRSLHLSEVVACGQVPAEPLPTEARLDLDEATYRFRAVVRTRSAHEVERWCRRILDAVARDPYAIAARFPGSPDALTALAARRTRAGIAWRTWHIYPQHRELVHTTTRLDLT